MKAVHFGNDATLELDLREGTLLADCGHPRGTPLDDPQSATVEAVSTPLDFPPLVLATVPGDQIVLALDPSTPRLPSIVAGIVETLVDYGADPNDITLLRALPSDPSQDSDPREELPLEVREKVHVLIHDPNHSEEHCHLANDAQGHEIRIHRALFDADVIVPVGCLRLKNAWSYHGVHSCIFPNFSDAKTQQMFHLTESHARAAERKKLDASVEEAAWDLGVVFTVQVIPGEGSDVLSILAGDPKSVWQEGTELCEAAWRSQSPRRAELVLATIVGGPEQQTWDNVARAVAAALPLATSTGAIAVCTDLNSAPGPALQQLAGAEDNEAVLKRIRKLPSPDGPAAVQLLDALEQVKLYLLSRLDENMVEELGIAPVTDAEEIARLTQRADSCILLANAQYAAVAVGEPE